MVGETRTSDDEGAARSILVPDGLDGDVEVVAAVPHGLVSEGSETELFECVVGVGDQFAKEDLSIAR